jgi:hypothetical protein
MLFLFKKVGGAMSTEELQKLLKDKEFTIEDVIDAVIQLNGVVGVGRISLGDTLQNYCYHRAKDYRGTGRDNLELNQKEEVVWPSNHRNGTT